MRSNELSNFPRTFKWNAIMVWFYSFVMGAAAGSKRAHFLERGAWFWSVCVYLFVFYVFCWFICTSITIVLVWWPKEHTSVSLLLFFRSYTKRDMLISCEKCSRLPLPRVTFKGNLKKHLFRDKFVWVETITVVVCSIPAPAAFLIELTNTNDGFS